MGQVVYGDRVVHRAAEEESQEERNNVSDQRKSDLQHSLFRGSSSANIQRPNAGSLAGKV